MARPIKDLRNKKFGKLCAIEFVALDKNRHAIWKCKCDCGTEKNIACTSLLAGHSTSCGCSKTKDLINQRFGRLLVLERYGSNGHYLLWLCKCDCGKEKIISSKLLLDGSTNSCGCLKIECAKKTIKNVRFNGTIQEKGLAAFNNLYARYRANAKHRHILFDLSKEQFRYLTSLSCVYCGRNPNQIMSGSSESSNGVYVYNGIDRIDSSGGYVLENSQACCKACNVAKYTMSEKEFLIWIKMVYDYRNLQSM